MSDGIKKYIIISTTIICIIVSVAICLFMGFNIMTFIISYLAGIIDGMVIVVVENE